MDGRRFLTVTRSLVQELDEESWRTAAGRAYYAVFLEARATLIRWGVSTIPHHQAHFFVCSRFANTPLSDLRAIGDVLSELLDLRNQANYEPERPGPFHSYFAAEQAVVDGEQTIALLDAINADPARRATAIAAILVVP